MYITTYLVSSGNRERDFIGPMFQIQGRPLF